ncbi:glutathione S-transferase P-like [Amphiura filiformis]|uniref:glutathione S-transferase P-like n=1 Tax=Amphiura filiformis TaxID=82378 RepID=UPI003B220BBC
MPEYKLMYFPIRGRGQAIRLLMLDQGVEFQESTIAFKEWPTLKATLAFGQCPVFYVDGETLVQSNTILRYLGKQCGLYGSTDMEAAYIDMLNDGVEDAYSRYLKMIYNDYENGKDDYVTKVLPTWLASFEKWLATKADGKAFLMGEKISYVDYNFFQFLDAQQILSSTCLDNLPLIKAYYERMAARPKLSEFLKSETNTKRNVNGNGKQ